MKSESSSRLLRKKDKRSEGEQKERLTTPSRSQAVFEADPRVRQSPSQLRSIAIQSPSSSAYSFSATTPLASPSRSFPSPLSPSSSTSSLRYSDSSSPSSSSFHTTPPSPVTWRAERTWNVDPYKLDDEEVDILGALLPVVAEEPKRRNLLNPGPSPSSSLRRSPSPSASAYSFPTTQHQLRHQQSISNRSHTSSTGTLPNPYPSPIEPLPPLPPRSSSSSTSITSLEYLRRRESDPLSAGSTSSLNAGMGRGGNEGTRSEVVGLETTLRRMHVTSDALLEGGKLRKEVGARNEGESRRSEKLSEATGERASESTWSRVERGVKSADRRRREEGIEMNVEEVLKSDSVNEEDEDEFSLPFLPPRHPILAPPPIPLSTRPCRSALPFSQSSSSLLLPPPVSPPPLIPLPPVPNSPILGDNHSRRSSATTEESTRETISTAPTSPLPAVKPSVYSPPNPSGYRSG